MNLLGQLILVCLVIVALQGLVAVLAIAIALSLIWGLFFRTVQTVGLIGLGLVIAALQAHPWLTIGVTVGLAGALLIRRSKRKEGAPTPPRLALPPPDSEPS